MATKKPETLEKLPVRAAARKSIIVEADTRDMKLIDFMDTLWKNWLDTRPDMPVQAPDGSWELVPIIRKREPHNDRIQDAIADFCAKHPADNPVGLQFRQTLVELLGIDVHLLEDLAQPALTSGKQGIKKANTGTK